MGFCHRLIGARYIAFECHLFLSARYHEGLSGIEFLRWWLDRWLACSIGHELAFGSISGGMRVDHATETCYFIDAVKWISYLYSSLVFRGVNYFIRYPFFVSIITLYISKNVDLINFYLTFNLEVPETVWALIYFQWFHCWIGDKKK